MIVIFQQATGEFPGGPVVRAQAFAAVGQGFNPWLEN